MAPIAKLGGYTLLASSPVRWRLAIGVHPVIETFDMSVADAKALLASASGRTVTLQMIGGGSSIEIRGLYVLHAAPGDNPFIARVTVADRRWLWPYTHILRRYNVRRRVGVKRIRTQDQAALDTSIPDLLFAPYSTKSGRGSAADRWTAEEILDDVLFELADAEAEFSHSGSAIPVVVGSPFTQQQFVDSLVIDEAGDAAVARALAAVPEIAIYINFAGDVVLFSRAAGGEAAMVAKLGPEYVGDGHLKFVSNRAVRPREVHVLFTREFEVRWNFAENSTTAQSGQQGQDQSGQNARFCDNVLPIPDRFLNLNGKDEAQGTWATFDDVLPAWGQPPLVAVGDQLDYPFLRTAMIPFNDFWGPLGILGSLDPSAEWSGRIRAIQTHYRQTYRINRTWMDRIFSLKAYSIGTIDQSTGQRGPARAYADHCYVSAKKHLFKQEREVRDGQAGGALTFATNVDGYPADGAIDANTRPAPAEVVVLDEDQGIVRLDYVVDPLGMAEICLPSKMDASYAPRADIRQREYPISFDTMVKSGHLPRLAASHKVAVILTAIPASPNTDQQLHRIIVKPSECSALLGAAAAKGLGDAKGPIMEIRVGPGVETARIPWHDSRAEQVEQAFGIKGGDPDFGGAVMNEDRASGGAASLNAIALAEAANVYASLCDRFEGSAAGSLNGAIVPSGWLAEVVHSIDTTGVVRTSVNLPERIPQLTVWQFMDKSTRAILTRAIE